MTKKRKKMANPNKEETIEDPPEVTAPKEGEEFSLESMLSGDDSESYKEQRGDKERKIILGDEDADDQGEEGGEEERESFDTSKLTDEDRAAARAFFGWYDDTTAKLFSVNVYGDWDSSDQFRTYGDLRKLEYEDLITCAAIVYNRWKFRWGPEMVIALSLSTNMGMKYQLAKTLKRDLQGKSAPADNIRNIKKNQKRQQTGTPKAKQGML